MNKSKQIYDVFALYIGEHTVKAHNPKRDVNDRNTDQSCVNIAVNILNKLHEAGVFDE